LGTTGFGLIDGTPIDINRDKYGLEPGPVSWLWKCHKNPKLTFWETIRRRLLMAEWCEMLGIRLDLENNFRTHLAFILKNYQKTIIDYSGPLDQPIDVTQYLPNTTDHQMFLQIVNSGLYPVDIDISTGNSVKKYTCIPGVTDITFNFARKLNQRQSITIDTKFENNHQTVWEKYDSGDYYDRHGLYINQVRLDKCDITYWGWNQLVDINCAADKLLPIDYTDHVNKRCLTSGLSLSIDMPEYYSPHKYLFSRKEPKFYQEKKFIDTVLTQRLNSFLV
jgi:hypothetical protein